MNIIEAVQAEVGKHPGARLSKVNVRVGELSGVEPEALRFSFETLLQDSGLAGAALEIDFRRVVNRCPACDRTFEVREFDPTCPACGARDTLRAGGDELEIAWLELEDA